MPPPRAPNAIPHRNLSTTRYSSRIYPGSDSEANIEAIADSVQGLEISSGITEDWRRQESAGSIDHCSASFRNDINKVCESLTRFTSSIRDAIDELDRATINYIIADLTSQAEQISPIITKLLSHFENEIRAIIPTIFDKSSDVDVLWKLAEEYYNQATSSSRSLNADDYFDSLEETSMGRPFDPDFESEEYYAHEDRLRDDGYSEAFEKKSSNRYEAKCKERQSGRETWQEFWFCVLKRSPAGPTLFNPAKGGGFGRPNSNDPPPYLFRTFDTKSSGLNNEAIIASAATESGDISHTDILGLDGRKATVLLVQHFKKPLTSAEISDNFISWTSSLPNAIQYAFYRHAKYGCSMSEIEFCAVDTEKFPQGQFAQDTWLLKRYEKFAKSIGGKEANYFWFRREYEEYHNGEYLSQGILKNKDRSYVFSLESLIQAGLLELYPEFADPEDWTDWDERLVVLRSTWSTEKATTDSEIELSLNIARNCFPLHDPVDIASIFLTFQNRQLQKENSYLYQEQPPSWAVKPVEVYRYWNSRKIARARGEAARESPEKRLRRIFQ